MADSLLDDLISWWLLEEAKGTRYDAHGSNHLTDNGTVLDDLGKVGNAADFGSSVAAKKHLSIASNASLQLGTTGFTFAAWLNPIASISTYVAAAKRQSSGAIEWQVNVVPNTGNLTFIWGARTVQLNSAVPAATWSLVIVGYDPITDKIYAQSNDGTPAESVGAAATIGTGGLAIGRAGDVDANYWLGLIDEPAIWSRWLTADERTRLSNGGAGLSYTDIATSAASSRPVLSSPYLIGDLR